MQAKLEPAELAYILHTLEAKAVVGVDNAGLFPDETVARDALLKRGFTQLQEHGWFVADNGQISANPRLMLMVAVMANPAYVLTATHFSAESQQTITGYLADELVVEQFLTPDGSYQLAQLESATVLMEHFTAAFSLSAGDVPAWPSFIFDSRTFETTLQQARAGDFAALNQALSANNLSAAVVEKISQSICQLKSVGKVEGAAIQAQNLRAWAEFAILRDDSNRHWLAYTDAQENTIELLPASAEQFLQQFQSLLDRLG